MGEPASEPLPVDGDYTRALFSVLCVIAYVLFYLLILTVNRSQGYGTGPDYRTS